MSLDELHWLASVLPHAYQNVADEFQRKVKPIQDDVQKICVSYKSQDAFFRAVVGCTQDPHGSDNETFLLYRLEVSRIGGKFALCVGTYKSVHTRNGYPNQEMLVACEPFDSMPLDIKMEALEAIDFFVAEYVVHVREKRKAILPGVA